MGENDGAWVPYSADNQRTQLEQTTGYSCGPQAMSCTQPDGSGWWLVTTAQTADAVDHHCFFYGSGSCGAVPLDRNFEFGSGWWALEAGLDWLSGFGAP